MHQHAHRVAALRVRKPARCRANAAFEAVADHAGAAPDAAFPGHSARCTVERRQYMLGLHVESVDVVEASVVGLGNYRQPPWLQRVFLRDLPLDDPVADHANAVRVGNRDWSLE